LNRLYGKGASFGKPGPLGERLMKKKIFYIIIIILLVISCDQYKLKKSFAKNIIKNVEEYLNKNSHLPDTVKDIGFEEKLDSLAYYKKISEYEYIVWGTVLGE
jgi:hypothetical protein